MVDLRRRGTRWNVFGITTHETFELDGGLTHFLEGRMDASFGTTPLAMQKAIRLMEAGLVNTEKIISHRFPLNGHPQGHGGDGPARAEQGDHQPMKAHRQHRARAKLEMAGLAHARSRGRARCGSGRRPAASAPPTWR